MIVDIQTFIRFINTAECFKEMGTKTLVVQFTEM